MLHPSLVCMCNYQRAELLYSLYPALFLGKVNDAWAKYKSAFPRKSIIVKTQASLLFCFRQFELMIPPGSSISRVFINVSGTTLDDLVEGFEIKSAVLRPIHTCDLLTVDYGVNHSLNNGLYCIKRVHSSLVFCQLLRRLKSSCNSSRLITVQFTKPTALWFPAIPGFWLVQFLWNGKNAHSLWMEPLAGTLSGDHSGCRQAIRRFCESRCKSQVWMDPKYP